MCAIVTKAIAGSKPEIMAGINDFLLFLPKKLHWIVPGVILSVFAVSGYHWFDSRFSGLEKVLTAEIRSLDQTHTKEIRNVGERVSKIEGRLSIASREKAEQSAQLAKLKKGLGTLKGDEMRGLDVRLAKIETGFANLNKDSQKNLKELQKQRGELASLGEKLALIEFEKIIAAERPQPAGSARVFGTAVKVIDDLIMLQDSEGITITFTLSKPITAKRYYRLGQTEPISLGRIEPGDLLFVSYEPLPAGQKAVKYIGQFAWEPGVETRDPGK